MVYQWKSGTRFGVAADVAAKIMNELEAEGRLSGNELVEASRPEDAPLHNEFEWDDSVAAEQWRCQQGRTMIAAITVIREEMPKSEPVRAYFHIEKNQPNYERIETIIRSEDKAAMLFKVAMNELKAFKAKYSGLEAFKKIIEDIDNLTREGEAV